MDKEKQNVIIPDSQASQQHDIYSDNSQNIIDFPCNNDPVSESKAKKKKRRKAKGECDSADQTDIPSSETKATEPQKNGELAVSNPFHERTDIWDSKINIQSVEYVIKEFVSYCSNEIKKTDMSQGDEIEDLDIRILSFLDRYRRVAPSGKRMNFDFTAEIHDEHLKYYSPRAYAFDKLLLLTCHTLLMEEAASWEDVNRIKEEQQKWFLGRDYSWFYYQLVTIPFIYLRLKEETKNSGELIKEYFHNSYALIAKLLHLLEEPRKNLLLDQAAAAMGPSLFDIWDNNTLNKINERELCFKALLFYMNPGYVTKETANFGILYDLTPAYTAQRNRYIQQLQSGVFSEKERPELKKYLATRFKLSFTLLDRLCFEESLINCSELHIETLVEVLLEYNNSGIKNDVFLLLQSFTKLQAAAFIKYVINYLERNAHSVSPKDNIRKAQQAFLQGTVFHAMSCLGTTQDQIAFWMPLINNRKEQAKNTQEYNRFMQLITYIIASECCIENMRVIKVMMKLDDPFGYPNLKKTYTNYTAQIEALSLKKRVQLLSKDEYLINQFCREFWLQYILCMLIEFSDPTNESCKPFQVCDYFLERILQELCIASDVRKQFIDTVYQLDFVVGSKLELYFQYRFATSSALSGKNTIEPFEFTGATWLETRMLPVAFSKALAERRESLYDQADFLNQWLGWSKKKLASRKINAHDLVLHYLINNSLLSSAFSKYASIADFIEDMSNFSERDYQNLVASWIFSEEATRNILLLFLFLHQDKEHNGTRFYELKDIIINVFRAVNFNFDSGLMENERFVNLFHQIVKYRFFINEIGITLYQIFLNCFAPKEPMALPVEEKPLVTEGPSKASAKRERRKAKKSAEEAVALKEKEAISLPIVLENTAKDNVSAEPLKTLLEDKSDSTVTILTSVAPDKSAKKAKKVVPVAVPVPVVVPEPVPVVIPTSEQIVLTEFDTLRQVRQQLSDILDQLDGINDHQDAELESFLKHNQKVLTAIRNRLKLKGQKGVKVESETNEPRCDYGNLRDKINRYHSLLDRFSSIQDESIKHLLKDLKPLNYLQCAQPELKRRLRLPQSTPILDLFRSLFAEDADVYAYGSILYMDHPLDIDLKMIWNDQECSIEKISKIFQDKMKTAGLVISPVKVDLLNGISFKIDAKGMGYDFNNHKEIGITLWVGNSKKRLPTFHHTSHSSAALHLNSGKVVCDDNAAEAILNNRFFIKEMPFEDPKHYYNMKVHILNVLMRACNQNKDLTLDDSAQDFISRIKKYEGNWENLQINDNVLYDALVGIVKRHINNFPVINDQHVPHEIYNNRTQTLLQFFKQLGFNTIKMRSDHVTSFVFHYIQAHCQQNQIELQLIKRPGFFNKGDISKEEGKYFYTKLPTL